MAIEFKCDECGNTEPIPDELTIVLALMYRKRYICSICTEARQELKEEKRKQLEDAWEEKEAEKRNFFELAIKADKEKFIREGMKKT